MSGGATIGAGLLRLLAVAALALPAGAAAQTFGTTSGHVEFSSHVPLHTFTGESEQLVGEIDLAERTVDFYVDLHTLRTGIGKRDRDMRSALEAETYPFAEFFGRLLTPFDPDVREPQPATVKGQFSLHGVTREVTVAGTLQREGDGIRVRAAWSVALDDFAIEPPRLLIVRVSNEQDVSIDALLLPKKDTP